MAISLKVECDPGSEISDAFQESIELSNRIRIPVEFNFNGVTCFVKPEGSVRSGVDEYHKAIESKSQYKYARSY